MKRYSYIPALFLSAAIALPAVAASARNTITAEQVAAAINGAGMKVSADQVMLLADVMATDSSPKLKVESMERQLKLIAGIDVVAVDDEDLRRLSHRGSGRAITRPRLREDGAL